MVDFRFLPQSNRNWNNYVLGYFCTEKWEFSALPFVTDPASWARTCKSVCVNPNDEIIFIIAKVRNNAVLQSSTNSCFGSGTMHCVGYVRNVQYLISNVNATAFQAGYFRSPATVHIPDSPESSSGRGACPLRSGSETDLDPGGQRERRLRSRRGRFERGRSVRRRNSIQRRGQRQSGCGVQLGRGAPKQQRSTRLGGSSGIRNRKCCLVCL